MIYDVIVIGGGPSGMMAAGRAAERGKKVLLLEKNTNLGEKLKITGNGRCNITNTTPDLKLLLKNYGKAEMFLYSSFVKFGVKETVNFFESRGIPIMVEEHNRAFPESEDANDVVKVLTKYLKDNKVIIKTNACVTGFVQEAGEIVGVKVNGKIERARTFVLATGGTSHPETGSTGDGFKWLQELGCVVVKPTPAVVPLSVKEKWIKDLAGISFEDIKINFYVDGVKKFFKRGRVLCTHFGVSGPLILNASNKVADLLHEGVVTATIDLFPHLDHGEFDKFLLIKIAENNNCSLLTILKYILPSGTAKVISNLIKMDPGIKVNNLTKQQRVEMVGLLKSLKITISGLMGLSRAVVVDGGLELKEINNKTMSLNKYKNLFVTGDLINIRRPSGGFSLQLCWTSGYIAGENV